MDKTAKEILIGALEEDLFRELRTYGFKGPEAGRVKFDDDVDPPKEALLHHFRQSMPSIGEVVLTVSVKPPARPTFVIIAGRVPPRGVKLTCPEEIVPPERATAIMLEEQAFLQASPRSGYQPFRQPLWAFLIGSPTGIRDSVRQAVRLLPHLIEWLRTRAASPYVFVNRPPRAASARMPEPPVAGEPPG